MQKGKYVNTTCLTFVWLPSLPFRTLLDTFQICNVNLDFVSLNKYLQVNMTIINFEVRNENIRCKVKLNCY